MQCKVLTSLILFLSCCSLLPAQSTAIVNGPTQAAAGDLVILDASSSDCDTLAWSLANSDKSFLPVEGGTKCVFASGQPGEYVFMLATAKGNADGTATVALAKHVLLIGELPTPPDPGPTPPGPRPPEPPPEPDLQGLAKESYDQAKAISRKTGEATAMARVMRATASKAAGLSWSIPEIAEQLRKENREQVFPTEESRQRWLSYQQWFGTVMQREVKTPSDAIHVLEELADGLEACETSAQRPVSIRDAPNDTIKGMIDSLKSDLKTLKNEVGP